MHLKEITNLLEKKISPKLFCLNPKAYGIQYGDNNNKLIRKVMITLDVSLEVIRCAIKKKVNLIISHHSLISEPIVKINKNLINKLSLLSKWPISIFVLGHSFIATEGGISETIMNVLYLKLENLFNIKNEKGVNIPLGRICSPKYYPNEKSITLEILLKRMKSNLNLENISYVGDLNKEIKKICIVGGELSKKEYLEKAVKQGCDCYISGKIKHHLAVFARDNGLNIIESPHYKSEIIALKNLSNYLSLEFPNEEFFWFDSKNPFTIYK